MASESHRYAGVARTLAGSILTLFSFVIFAILLEFAEGQYDLIVTTTDHQLLHAFVMYYRFLVAICGILLGLSLMPLLVMAHIFRLPRRVQLSWARRLLGIVLIAAAVNIIGIIAIPTWSDFPSSVIWPTPEFWPLYLKFAPFTLVTLFGGLLLLNLPGLLALGKRPAKSTSNDQTAEP